ncbi:hypothetical protein [Geomesophilobacter sediminis]|uniref:Uncharacterized protein n=1 Tax=Geomesophilobacter sediminis TaxID=2798584 RepID=A0A8J7JKY9_9BACT|nr:hypothetical protein [Geomesophilobacter sediminis]MBJ6724325.1 hypothetical protein [Geomesophilobacter sediminis]
MVRTIVAAALVLGQVALASADDKQEIGKDRCLFDVKLCPGGEEYNIVDKYDHLKEALEKGASVYTPEELIHLKKSQKSTEETLTLLGIGCH